MRGWPLSRLWPTGTTKEIPFSVADVYFELYDTDGDLGIHALIDGEPWKKLEILEGAEVVAQAVCDASACPVLRRRRRLRFRSARVHLPRKLPERYLAVTRRAR